jgi:hypothetical protein
MNFLRTVYHLVRADVLERVRRNSFLIILGGTVYAGYMMVPSVEAPYNAFIISGYRGYYNSPWVGTVFGLIVSTMLTLIGFYLIKGAVSRDYSTGVGQIIAATPISKPAYILGKWLSNLTVLTLILVALTVMAPIMQLIRAEGALDIWALVIPIWFMGFPALAIVAAIAVLFESIPFLRGGTGNVVYFIIWLVVLGISVGTIFMSVDADSLASQNDFTGLSNAVVDIHQQMRFEDLDITQGTTDIGVPTRGREVARFFWDGMDWSARIFLERSLWMFIAVAIAIFSAIPFDRFDPSHWKIGRQRKQKQKRSRQQPGILQKLSGISELSRPTWNETVKSGVPDGILSLTPLEEQQIHRRFLPVLLAELRLMVRGQKWWWFFVALGIVVASLFSPLNVVRLYLFPAAWLWPILWWSALGNREYRYHTNQIVFSTPNLIRRQFFAIWFAGFLVALITGSGAGVRFVQSGLWDHLLAWGVGAAFIPSLALALGVWSRNKRLFEIVYLLWWYLGSISLIPILDYMGIISRGMTHDVTIIYFIASVLLLSAAIIGRRRQIQA